MTLARVLRGIRDPLDAGYVLGRVKGRGPPQPIKMPLGVITPHGTANVQPGNAELTALAALSGTGLVVRTAAATYAVRTLVAGTGISITNPDGVAGNVTINATGGTGTVTTLSVVTANGASGSVANPTTTPAITLSFATQATSDNSTKVATTAYVTTAIANAVAGVNPAVTVQAATTAAANTSGFTYNNGVAGIGATLTGSVNTAVTIDGYTFTALGQRLLVKNDTQSPSGAYNGVYYVTQIQTVLLPPILTRALDYDMPSDINNTGAIPVVNGTVNALTSWLLTSTVNTVGTDPLTYTQFSYATISAANPTATASDAAVNGSAATFMRSDAAPAIQKTSSSVFGLCKVDGTTITAAAGVISAVGGGGATLVAPQGRPTLTSGKPVMTADATAQTTVYYDSFVGGYVPIYGGSTWSLLAITGDEISMGLDAGVPHVASGSVYDIWAVSNSGALAIGVGPAWSSTTSRGTGAGTTELQLKNGIWTNKNALTHVWGGASGTTDYGSVAANQATYLGSLYATGNGQTGMAFNPTAASGGSNNILGLYSAYNRIPIRARERDSATTWTYNSTTWRQTNNNSNNRITFLDGLQQSFLAASLQVGIQSGGFPNIGINIDSTSADPTVAAQCGNLNSLLSIAGNFSPLLGLHYVQGMEMVAAGTGGYVANEATPTRAYHALLLSLEM